MAQFPATVPRVLTKSADLPRGALGSGMDSAAFFTASISVISANETQNQPARTISHRLLALCLGNLQP